VSEIRRISLRRTRILRVKRTGDGALVEFRSVVDAVRCAIEIQNAMVERNAGLAADRRIDFRIGIHLGDVVEESDGDLMGDGVNIAARLEGIAAPGAICLSEDAYRQVSGRLDMEVTDLGERDGFEPSVRTAIPRSRHPASNDFLVVLRGIELTISQAHFRTAVWPTPRLARCGQRRRARCDPDIGQQHDSVGVLAAR
jgi:adenylate/guanylate cyclase family protein